MLNYSAKVSELVRYLVFYTDTKQNMNQHVILNYILWVSRVLNNLVAPFAFKE